MNFREHWEKWESTIIQWIRFNAVGAMGIVVQLILLTVLTTVFHVHYQLATFLGVEAAVIHNFIWHERWTWAHAAHGGTREMLQRFVKFNLTTGLFSIAGNLGFMQVLVGVFHFHVLPANIIAIGACNLLNFFVSHLFVFRHREQ